MSSYAMINGKILPENEANLNINDIGLLRGYGIFDFFRAIEGTPIFLDDYLDRFERSTSALGLKYPYTREDIIEMILKVIELNPHPLLGVKLICTGGFSTDGYKPTTPNFIILAKPFKFHPYDQGLSLMTVNHLRELYTVKSTNYITPISLIPKLQANKADDVLYYQNSFVSESSRSNIFIVKKGVLITPSDGILEGITRKKVLSFAHEILPIEVRQVTLTEVFEADEVFLTASTKRISPVTKIDAQLYDSGPFTQKLYDRLLEEERKNRLVITAF